MKTTLMCLVAVAVITLLAPSVITFANGNAQAPPVAGEGANSVRITVGGETVANVAEGDVVYEGEKVSDDGAGKDAELPLCDIPGVRMQFSGDVRRVRVGLAKGACNLIVKDLVMNFKPLPTHDDNAPASTAINAQLGYEWHIESLGKVVGINSIDDLTKTYARFHFKTQYITGGDPLLDGSTARREHRSTGAPPVGSAAGIMTRPSTATSPLPACTSRILQVPRICTLNTWVNMNTHYSAPSTTK